MVALGPLDIVKVGSDEVGLHFSEPFRVVEKTEVVLEPDVSEVVPVADLGAVFKVLLEGEHFAFIGDVFVFGAGFDGEDDPGLEGGFDEPLEGFDGPLEILGAGFFAFLDAFEFVVGVLVGELFSGGEAVGEGSGPFSMRHGGDGAHVENDVLSLKALGHFERLHRFPESAISFGGIVGGKLVGVGRVDHHLGRRGKVVMDAHALEFPGIESSLDSGEFGHGHTVGEFEGAEAEIEDFIDHGFTVGVAGIVPTGGEGEHWNGEF